jgi:hypothetical protein
MLTAPRSSCLSCALMVVSVAARLDPDSLANRVRLTLTMDGTAVGRVTTGEAMLGTGTGLRSGYGSAGTLAALPIPLGSLTEPLSPRALAGPGGMPLTPASCAGDLATRAKRAMTATIGNVRRLHEKIEGSCGWLIKWQSLAAWSVGRALGKNLQGQAKVPCSDQRSCGKSTLVSVWLHFPTRQKMLLLPQFLVGLWSSGDE